jgi:hypothetical protein
MVVENVRERLVISKWGTWKFDMETIKLVSSFGELDNGRNASRAWEHRK